MNNDYNNDETLGGKKRRKTKKVIRFKAKKEKDGYSVKVKNKIYKFKNTIPLEKAKQYLTENIRPFIPFPVSQNINIPETLPIPLSQVVPKVLPYPDYVKQQLNPPPQPKEEPVKINPYFVKAENLYGHLTSKAIDTVISELIKQQRKWTLAGLKREVKPDTKINFIATLLEQIDMENNSTDSSVANNIVKNTPDQIIDQVKSEVETQQDLNNQIIKVGGKLDRGMTNIEIDKVMDKLPGYLGTICHDEFKSKILPNVEEKSRGACIINTDPSYKDGTHWQCLYWDARPEGDHEIDWFDSYGDKIDKKLLNCVKELATTLNAEAHLKFKENRVRYQGDSNNCGPFCMKFIIDRYDGKPFKHASGYDTSDKVINDVKYGEKNIEKFKFKYIPSYKQEHIGGNIITGEYYSYWPPQVQKYIKSIGDELITDLKVGRYPLSKNISTILRLVTFGGFDRAKKELGYDNMFHVFLIINNKYVLERNHVTTMKEYSPHENEEQIVVNVAQNQNIQDFMDNTASRYGPQLQRYSASNNNCQDFVIQALASNGLLNESISAFVKQDIEKLFKKLPWYSKFLSDLATDFAHKIEKTKQDIFGL